MAHGIVMRQKFRNQGFHSRNGKYTQDSHSAAQSKGLSFVSWKEWYLSKKRNQAYTNAFSLLVTCFVQECVFLFMWLAGKENASLISVSGLKGFISKTSRREVCWVALYFWKLDMEVRHKQEGTSAGFTKQQGKKITPCDLGHHVAFHIIYMPFSYLSMLSVYGFTCRGTLLRLSFQTLRAATPLPPSLPLGTNLRQFLP